MNTLPEVEQPVVVLIGNYPLDQQESMLRFRNLLQEQLTAAGFVTESIFPRGYVGGLAPKGGLAKWLGYVDKYIFFLPALASRLSAIRQKHAGRKVIVHICDHSNAVYVAMAKRWFPVVVTCHDLLAVRGALGRATAVVCVSRATESDLVRLLGAEAAKRSEVIPLALNYAYRALTREEAQAVLNRAGIDLPYQGYVLHVGSSLPRKNREALLLSVAQIQDEWKGLIVFAGEKLTGKEKALADSLGLGERVREISRPANETLAAIYSAAHAFIFMSRFEGFGWPVLEAQMSKCPVICSNRTSVPEVAGDGALVREPDDYAGIGADIRRLQEPAIRESLIALGLKNARSYSNERMMSAYEQLYQRI
jgi:glycosyltransferase involved in cell wall biosynthesis